MMYTHKEEKRKNTDCSVLIFDGGAAVYFSELS